MDITKCGAPKAISRLSGNFSLANFGNLQLSLPAFVSLGYFCTPPNVATFGIPIDMSNSGNLGILCIAKMW